VANSPTATRLLKVAVIGAGWAGLAAAVRARQQGHHVTVFEMAQQLGGRARGVRVDRVQLDNGQHILIGAYTRTLALMATVGAVPDRLFHRQPLEIRYPDGRGLKLPAGPAALVFGWAVMRCKGWTVAERLALLRAAASWAVARFRCSPELTVATLCHGLPPAVRELLIDPLCVAALNTPAAQASASVWLRVLRDALFSGAGSADLLLPRRSLSEVLPQPAQHWLMQAAVTLRLGQRVDKLTAADLGWRVDDERFDAVVLACTAKEAARLAQSHAPAWAADAQALTYEPIITVYAHCEGARLAAPMTALQAGPDAPAQFVFDHGALGGTPGLFAFVISGARPWVAAGLPAAQAAVLRQAHAAFPAGTWPQPWTQVSTLAEKRATFACVPGMRRPPASVAPGLMAAGDYVQGPYPATLEGAVRSGEAAAALLAPVRATNGAR
jgi:hydroxysqualene dehydroxylase